MPAPTPLTPEEKRTILNNISIYFDESEGDPHSRLAEALGCERSAAKTKFWQYLYTDDGMFQRNFVKKPMYEATYLVTELSKLTGLTRREVQQNAWNHSEEKLAAHLQRRGTR